jgi:SAM-dependent methyltransferase
MIRRRLFWRRVARRGFYGALRVVSQVERALDSGRGVPLPPADLRYYYYRTWKPAAFWKACEAARTEILSHGLEPQHRLLDVGSGIGNLALGLKDFLTGGYQGLEIHPQAVAWCQRAITSRYPGFLFHRADIHSQAYNPRGGAPAAKYRFPFADGTFDVVFLGSVFTHLLPDATDNYIREIGRVLAPGGTMVASFFLLDESTRADLAAGRSFMSFDIDHSSKLCRLHDASVPEAAVAIDEPFVTRALAQSGLRIRDIRRGRWSQGISDDQDVVTGVRQPESLIPYP